MKRTKEGEFNEKDVIYSSDFNFESGSSQGILGKIQKHIGGAVTRESHHERNESNGHDGPQLKGQTC